MAKFQISYDSTHGRQTIPDLSTEATKIDLSRRSITEIDLTPLTQCAFLEILDLSNNKIDAIDLTPLKEMDSLKVLRLRSNKIHHINLWPLSHLPELVELDLSQNILTQANLTPVIQRICVKLDENIIVELDYTLRYLLSGKDSTRLRLCNDAGKELERSPRMNWKQFGEILSWEVSSESLKDRLMFFIEKADDWNWFRLQKGMLEGFGLNELAGFDGDPQLLLEGIDFREDLHTVRNAIQDRAIECLELQIRNGGSTLFLDVQKMAGNRSSKLVPQVLEARDKEMQNATVLTNGNRANLFPLWCTHYGFTLLSVLNFGLITDKKGLDLIERNLEQLGHSMNKRKFEIDELVYPDNMSKGLADFIYSFACMN